MVRNFVVSISPADAARIIIEAITQEKQRFFIDTRAGVLLDDHRVECPSGTVISLVFTKYYARVASFVTLVVVISNLTGETTVHASTGGHLPEEMVILSPHTKQGWRSSTNYCTGNGFSVGQT